MKDKGINRGLVQDFETSKFGESKSMWGWRKMFWDYLKKLNVAFSDVCCDDASVADKVPMRFDYVTGVTEIYDPVAKEWIDKDDWVSPTTTTTTTAATTTTTTTTP